MTVEGCGFRVWSGGFGVWGRGFWGLGCEDSISGSGIRVQSGVRVSKALMDAGS